MSLLSVMARLMLWSASASYSAVVLDLTATWPDDPLFETFDYGTLGHNISRGAGSNHDLTQTFKLNQAIIIHIFEVDDMFRSNVVEGTMHVDEVFSMPASGQWYNDTNTERSQYDYGVALDILEPASMVLLGLSSMLMVRRRR